MLDREESAITFDPETFQSIWRERESTTWVISVLNKLNRAKVKDVEIAEQLEIHRSQITKWRGGQHLPSNYNKQALLELLKRVEGKNRVTTRVTKGNKTPKPNRGGRPRIRPADRGPEFTLRRLKVDIDI